MFGERRVFKHIIITGASSGIGQALAERFARKGIVLGLLGRDPQRLAEVEMRCVEKGAKVISSALDVVDREAMREWICGFDGEYPVDLVIANAGISAGTEGVLAGEPPEQVRRVFDVNLMGVLNTIEPLQERMVARKSGNLAIVSSLAGYRGWPGAPAYCASKAAVRVYGESLRGALMQHNVGVNVICPGFVVSRMTKVNEFPMPFIIESGRAAEIIISGLIMNKGRIAFPFIPSFMAWIFMVVPDFISHILLRKMPKKK